MVMIAKTSTVKEFGKYQLRNIYIIHLSLKWGQNETGEERIQGTLDDLYADVSSVAMCVSPKNPYIKFLLK